MIVIIDSVQTVKNNINKILAKQLDLKLRATLNNIEALFENHVTAALKASNVYISLVQGPLNMEFGMKPSTARKLLDGVISQLVKQISIKYNPPRIINGELEASIEVGIVKSGFKDILQSKFAHFDTSKDGGDSGLLNWLEWLLVYGDSIVVTGFNVKFGNYNTPEPSRTGGAIMVPSKTKWWRVPPEYSGTIDNNWITRALTDSLAEIEIAFFELMRKSL